MNASPLLLVVAAALVDANGRVLVQQRPMGKPMAGLWEFPGGKVDADEAPEDALVRELGEELGLAIRREHLIPAVFASEPLKDRSLLLLLYLCREWRGTPTPHAAQALAWKHPRDLYAIAMPPADKPLIGLLERLIGH